MSEQQFGGDWTERKLEKVRKYLPAYTKIMKKTWFTTAYIDAFAGTGYREAKASCPEGAPLFDELEAPEMERYRSGSARLALETNPPFDQYIFIEKDVNKCNELETLRNDFPNIAKRILIHNQEANEYLANICGDKKRWEKRRAVIFLDPFGMQVNWNTIELIAATEAIDLWYLFPIGAVNRLLERAGCKQPGFSERLDQVFGTHSWEERFYHRSSVLSLFEDDEAVIKDADFSRIAEYILERLRSVFAGVAEKPYIMRNSKQSPIFMLCFAVGNLKGKIPALNIANYILKD